jgi:hypothetical protein
MRSINVDVDESGLIDANALLCSLATCMLSGGLEPGTLFTSREIADAVGWTRLARTDDLGGLHLLGMRIEFVDVNVVMLRAATSATPFCRLDCGMPFSVEETEDGRVFLRAPEA